MMSDYPHPEYKVISTRESADEFTDRLAREDENGWTVVGFACDNGCVHALLRRMTE